MKDMMKYWKIQFASEYRHGWFYNEANKFKYSKTALKQVLENGLFADLLATNNLFVAAFDKFKGQEALLTIDPTQLIARVTKVDVDEKYAELMCMDKSYPKCNKFMKHTEDVALGFITVGEYGSKDKNGYTIYTPKKFIRLQLVYNTGKAAELLYDEANGANENRSFDNCYEDIQKQLRGEIYD